MPTPNKRKAAVATGAEPSPAKRTKVGKTSEKIRERCKDVEFSGSDSDNAADIPDNVVPIGEMNEDFPSRAVTLTIVSSGDLQLQAYDFTVWGQRIHNIQNREPKSGQSKTLEDAGDLKKLVRLSKHLREKDFDEIKRYVYSKLPKEYRETLPFAGPNDLIENETIEEVKQTVLCTRLKDKSTISP